MEEDASSPEKSDALFRASDGAGEKLYKRGDFAASQVSTLDIYLLKKVVEGCDFIQSDSSKYPAH